MVRNTLVKRFATGFATWLFLAGMMLAATTSTVQAQQQSALPDFESPIIEHSTAQGGRVGGVEVFGATVVDNVNVGKVSLFYRFTGEKEFAEVQMREVASSSYYSAKVDTANVPADANAIEYYLEAKDTSGNIVLKGFAFQPLVRTFKVDPPVEEEAVTPIASSDDPKINWVYVGLGILAAGTLAAVLSDSGDSGGPELEACTDTCLITVTIDPP